MICVLDPVGARFARRRKGWDRGGACGRGKRTPALGRLRVTVRAHYGALPMMVAVFSGNATGGCTERGQRRRKLPGSGAREERPGRRCRPKPDAEETLPRFSVRKHGPADRKAVVERRKAKRSRQSAAVIARHGSLPMRQPALRSPAFYLGSDCRKPRSVSLARTRSHDHAV